MDGNEGTVMNESVGCSAVRGMRVPDRPAAIDLLGELLSLRAVSKPRRMDRPFALYGAGKLGHMAMDFFSHVRLTPTVVVDSNADRLRDDPYWQSLKILPPSLVTAGMKSGLPLVVSIATTCFTELAETLRSQGWQDIVPVYDVMEAYRDRYPIGNGWFMGSVNSTERTMIKRVLANWTDDVSRAHYLQFLAWHRLRQDWVFDGALVDAASRYFIPEILSVLGEQETFVDVGAHMGEIAKAFRDMVGNRFARVIMFEPDPRNAAVIQEGLTMLPEPIRGRHTLFTQALSHRSGKRPFFSQLGYGSQLCEVGSDFVEVRALDDMDVAPSYVKLHLEGHELMALQGAEATIRRHRPVLAVTIYHSDVGVWKLPSWLMELLTDYHYYLRLHSWCGTGAVMYGVPMERRRTSSHDGQQYA